MASGLVIHIEAGEGKHTEVVSRDHIRIGPGEECDLRLRSSDAGFIAGTILELTSANGHYRVASFDESVGITHNAAPLEVDAAINDGDYLRIASSDVALQFFSVRQLPERTVERRREARVTPFIEQASADSAATARRDDAKVFLREFTRELIHEINPLTKILTLVITTVLVGGILYLGFSGYRELQRYRRLTDAQNAQLELMRALVAETSDRLNGVSQSNNEILQTLSLPVRLRNDYGNGVCLIAVHYQFVEPGTNRPLRYAQASADDDAATGSNTDERPLVTPEGSGAIIEFQISGTGFHVGDGFVLTNRHIAAEPWAADERAQALSGSTSGRPRITKLLAYFPGRRQPLPLTFKGAAQRNDVAVCVLDTKGNPVTNIPALPLDQEDAAVAVGKPVVMMGYSSGLDRLLALLPAPEARSVQTRYGSPEELLGYLAEHKAINPDTTQGNITDKYDDRVVHDARTSTGGSGSPLFGSSGKVIGISYATFTESTASNFAVPVRYGVTLLQRLGWNQKESSDPSGNSDSTLRNMRSNPAAATTANK